MAPKMQPEVVSREFVKPSASSSQNHPTVHYLSFFDKFQRYVYVPILFFYTFRDGETGPDHRSSLLKSSLSAALSHYYPLAGRIKDDFTIDCNDEGALFLEARMESHLSEILTDPDSEALEFLCPDSLSYKSSFQTGRVVVQVTYFKCRGMSIGLCLCHRIMDMVTMSSFINDWASLARMPDKEIVRAEFNIGSSYRPLDLALPTGFSPQEVKLVWRRLVFSGSKIADLKGRVEHEVGKPTRVEVVSALLHKSSLNAVARANSWITLKPTVMNHAINLRAHVTPPFSKKNKGNMAGTFPVLTPETKEVDLGWLVNEFRTSKTRFTNLLAKASSAEEVCSLTCKNMEIYGGAELYEVFTCSSWCRNQLHESDFGWGNPLWVGPTPFKVKNLIFLMDTREGDGVEAHICLEDKVMAVFEEDEELLSFCSLNPSIM